MRAVSVLHVVFLALAVASANAQSPVSLSSSTAAVTFSAARSGNILAQLGTCSGHACSISGSSAAGSFSLSSTGPLVLAATASPGVFSVVQNGSLLFSETSANGGTVVSGSISLLDFIQSGSGVSAVGRLQPANGAGPVLINLLFNSLDLADMAGGCQSGATAASGEYIGSALSGAGWSHMQSQFCPKATVQITIPSLQTPAHPVGGPPPGGPVPTPEPSSLLLLLSGAFTTGALLRRPSL